MSGGSYDYLCDKYSEELFDCFTMLRKMSGRLLELGYDDAAKDTITLLTIMTGMLKTIDVRADRIREVWKAVEWYDSSDWGLEEVVDAIQKYRKYEDTI